MPPWAAADDEPDDADALLADADDADVLLADADDASEDAPADDASEGKSLEAASSEDADELAGLCEGAALTCWPENHHMAPAPAPTATRMAMMTATTLGAADLPAAFRALL